MKRRETVNAAKAKVLNKVRLGLGIQGPNRANKSQFSMTRVEHILDLEEQPYLMTLHPGIYSRATQLGPGLWFRLSCGHFARDNGRNVRSRPCAACAEPEEEQSALYGPANSDLKKYEAVIVDKMTFFAGADIKTGEFCTVEEGYLYPLRDREW